MEGLFLSSGQTKLKAFSEKGISVPLRTKTVTKAFILFYLHRILPEEKFQQFLKKISEPQDMLLSIRIFNGTEINLEELLKFIQSSKTFFRMCERINLTNKLVLKYLSHAQYVEVRDSFHEATNIHHTDITLESLLQSTTSFNLSQFHCGGISQVIDLTGDNSKSSSSGESDSSSEEHESAPPIILRSQKPIAPKRPAQDSQSTPHKLPKYAVVELSKGKDQTPLKPALARPTASNIPSEATEEEGLIPLSRKESSSTIIEPIKEVLKMPGPILNAPSKGPVDSWANLDRSKTKWTFEEDKLFLSLVCSKGSAFSNWSVKKRSAEFEPYKGLFQRTASSLYVRWNMQIYPFLYLYHRDSDILCWRLLFFKLLKDKGYKSVNEIPWLRIIDKSHPLTNVTVYKSLLQTYVMKSSNKSIPDVVNLAIATLMNKHCYTEELRSYYRGLLEGQQQKEEHSILKTSQGPSNHQKDCREPSPANKHSITSVCHSIHTVMPTNINSLSTNLSPNIVTLSNARQVTPIPSPNVVAPIITNQVTPISSPSVVAPIISNHATPVPSSIVTSSTAPTTYRSISPTFSETSLMSRASEAVLVSNDTSTNHSTNASASHSGDQEVHSRLPSSVTQPATNEDITSPISIVYDCSKCPKDISRESRISVMKNLLSDMNIGSNQASDNTSVWHYPVSQSSLSASSPNAKLPLLVPLVQTNNNISSPMTEPSIPTLMSRTIVSPSAIPLTNCNKIVSKKNQDSGKWTLKKDVEVLFLGLKVNFPRSDMKVKKLIQCKDTQTLASSIRETYESMSQRWSETIQPSLLKNKKIKDWEYTLLSTLISLKVATYIGIPWERIRIPNVSKRILMTYIRANTQDLQNIPKRIRSRLSVMLSKSYQIHPPQKTLKETTLEDNNPSSQVSHEPFTFSESKVLVEIVFLHHPNLDLESCELKPSFFVNALPSRSLHSVYMHWEKLVCVNLFATRQDNWKISFLEYIGHWQFGKFQDVFQDEKVTKLYSYVPEDTRKGFIKTCILFADSVMRSASFLSKIQFCYQYLRLKKDDLALFDEILGYSIPLFSPYQTKDKTWKATYKARTSFSSSERLLILKKVIQYHPNEAVEQLCPSIEFFTSIALEFDRSYVSLKYQWERSIRVILLLCKHNRLKEKWESNVLKHILSCNTLSRSGINWPEVQSAFPYLTTTAMNHLVIKAIKTKKTGTFRDKLFAYKKLVQKTNISKELKPWTPVIDYYKSYIEIRKVPNRNK